MIRSVRQFIVNNQHLLLDIPALLKKARNNLDLSQHKNLLICLHEAKIDIPADKVFPIYQNYLMTFSNDVILKYAEYVTRFSRFRLPFERSDLTLDEIKDRIDNCGIGCQVEQLISNDNSVLDEASIYTTCYDSSVIIEMSLRNKRSGDVIFVATQMQSGILYDDVGYWLLTEDQLMDQVNTLESIFNKVTE